ncbi:hypothetical protein KEM60_00539 [Austwickia sp. TVS 96-490-7B]|uniref:family 10 glycosylhydrolase n=1 Tax=Austwickia sp. TVS 96-490-7B TaxID=2830843 RepID=UPI001C59879B|nr:family 10 glycosylhydrolase [Austwickia sp. TVS 96-490-7B]MBW3084352.1 hypothetical protein [Austwickia sp. TVS 96-490-7B]
MSKFTVTAAALLILASPLTTPTASASRPASSPSPASTGADSPSTTGGTSSTAQWRSYWVDAFNPGIYTRAQVTQLVSDAQKVGANTLVVQTARRFDCFCNHARYPRTEAGIAPAPYDPLAEIITQAHAAGLQVHAWINTTTLWNSATPPTSPDHVFNQHGPTASAAQRWLNRRVDGTEIVGTHSFVDPGNPAVVDYIVDAVDSIQRHYDVDGINLDYIRYPDHNTGEYANDWGYTDVALRRFAAHTGRTDRPTASDPQWSQWRRDQISNLVRRIYLSMYTRDPRDRLSINGITYAYGPSHYGSFSKTRTYLNVLQDFDTWLREGYLDTVAAMNYKRQQLPEQAEMFTTWNDGLRQLGKDTHRHIVSGPGLYLNSVTDSVAQARAITQAGMGWSGFSYANASTTATASPDPKVKTAERDALAAALTASVFTTPATVPELPWKKTTGVLSGRIFRHGRPADNVSVTIRRTSAHRAGINGSAAIGDTRLIRTDGSGWYGAAGLTPGTYQMAITHTGVNTQILTVQVPAGRNTRLDLQLDDTVRIDHP